MSTAEQRLHEAYERRAQINREIESLQEDARREAEMDRIKFHLWLGMDPVHNSDGDIVRWNETDMSRYIVWECRQNGETPLQRWKKEADND